MNYFEELEKGRYGSFELKKQVGPNLLKGFVFSLLLLSTLAASPLVLSLLVGEKPQPPDGPVYGGIPPLVHFNPDRTIGHIQFPRLNPMVPKNAIPVPVAVDDDDTLTMELPPSDLPGFPGEGDTSGSGGFGEGNGNGFDTSSLAGLAIPVEIIPPETTFTPYEIAPVPLDINPQPAYPILAKTSGMTGKVVVKMYVDKTGTVRKWKIVQVVPAELGFDDEVTRVIPDWKFTPAVQSGKPVGVWVSIPFKFALKR